MQGQSLLTSNLGALSSSGASLMDALGRLALFVVVIVLAYYCTRWLAKWRRGAGGGLSLSVRESVAVSQSAQVSLVRAGKRHFLVGVSKESVNLLAELTEDDITAPEGDSAEAFSPIKVRDYFRRSRKENRHDGEDKPK